MTNEKELYDSLASDNLCTITYKDHFTDRNGYLNENAFQKFTEYLRTNNELPDYYLICLNIDLRLANAESTAVGDYVLRKFIVALDDFFVFRIQGEKFNILATKEQIPHIKQYLDTPNDKYKVYYGIVKEKPYKPQNEAEQREIIHKGISMMYESKGEKKVSTIIDAIGNEPKELHETKLKKYCDTMWYSIISLTITEPIYREITIYVYPTEWKEATHTLPILIAAYDNVEYNIKVGTLITFGINGFRFSVSCRFDTDKHLSTAIFSLDNDKCKCKISTQTHEGVCIPTNFGKRITRTCEIYPLRRNQTGLFDYIALDDGAPKLNTTGYIETPNGMRYGVSMNDKSIDLIAL